MARHAKSVLLVDDDPADRTLFSRDLRRLGFEVIQTGSPEEAMAAIVGGRVGCLITDQVMTVPGKNWLRLPRAFVKTCASYSSPGHLPGASRFPPGLRSLKKMFARDFVRQFSSA
ncbi:MAG TPA: response regulator [Terriglobales bacterium]|nr:response regulator [Terriglobales bacterium]